MFLWSNTLCHSHKTTMWCVGSCIAELRTSHLTTQNIPWPTLFYKNTVQLTCIFVLLVLSIRNISANHSFSNVLEQSIEQKCFCISRWRNCIKWRAAIINTDKCQTVRTVGFWGVKKFSFGAFERFVQHIHKLRHLPQNTKYFVNGFFSFHKYEHRKQVNLQYTSVWLNQSSYNHISSVSEAINLRIM